MDWFKKNPFLGGIAIAAVLILLGGGYLVSSATGRLSEAQSAFDSKKSELESLQHNKPFPDQANLDAALKESAQADQLLGAIAKKFEVSAPPITPQEFQDNLSKLVKEITRLAADRGVALPEKFFLGFEAYEAEPPPASVAPQLGLQLRSIHAVTKVLIESQVKSIGRISRDPLHGEAGTADSAKNNAAPGKKGGKPSAPAHARFGMAPFDVSFTSDQPAARTAFNRILDITPPVFVRLVAITNSAIKSPLKAGEAKDQPAAAEAAGSSAIKPVFGRETITVSLRLASITGQSSGAN